MTLPEEITPAQLAALRFIASFRHVQKLRGASGYGLPGHKAEVSLVTADKLLQRRLVRKDLVSRFGRTVWTLTPTGEGRNILTALEARAERRSMQ